MLHVGIDVGSISVNTVLINDKWQVIYEFYDRTNGRPYFTLLNRLNKLSKVIDDFYGIIACTGSGGKLASKLLKGVFINEVIAQAGAVSHYYPGTRTVIEMGGEDSKLIMMGNGEIQGRSRLSDFSMNNLCAAGTGSFLDQQAKRMGLHIEDEFGRLALASENPPRIAGRCSVFAKSDMIHLQQVGTPVHDIIAGLCFAVARNYKSTLGRGKNLEKPVLFQGGVAANIGMRRAFQEIYAMGEDDLVVPKHYASMGAIGAVLHSMNNKNEYGRLDLSILTKYLGDSGLDAQYLEPLKDSHHNISKEIHVIAKKTKIPAYLGIDVGSLSTNLAVIDRENRVLARQYLPTASRPLNAIQKGLNNIFLEIGDQIIIKGVGTTGSGRYLTGDFVGADTIQNEITAQATAAVAHDPDVDTIFEIGGQDSKYICIENGVITDFEMNKVCAAGTGSFLEEQADKLGININEEFGKLGLKAEHPVKLGERCTVFMESDLNTHLQKGVQTDNLVAGLSYSIVYNYINRVVRDKRIGNKIFFQGGVTNNRAVVAAFEKVTGKQITIPPHFDITGAIGAAILARNNMNGAHSKFKGFNISKIQYNTDRFTCKHCANHCEIKRIRIEGEKKPLLYGGICERYEVDSRRKENNHIPNLFEEREKYLMEGYHPQPHPSKKNIGVPKALMNYYQNFPFWRAFFSELGFNIILSENTNQNIINQSLESIVSETCLPIEVIHGHVLNLWQKDVDYIFLPFVVNARTSDDNPTSNCNCPWIQSHPYLVKAAFTDEKLRKKLLIPCLHFKYFDRVFRKELQDYFSEKFNLSRKEINGAINKAVLAQDAFEGKVKARGYDIIQHLKDYKRAVVIMGRPYNTSDPALNLRLVQKLIKREVLPIPLDFLPLDKINIFSDYPNMYWPNGRKIIAAARYISKNEQLSAIYLSNFRCGPDSFLIHFVKNELQDKPFLHLEIDEHSADAGMITRCEAFLDSLKGKDSFRQKENKLYIQLGKNGSERTIYFPYARDVVHILSAATRHCGISSEVLPMQDEQDIELGRKHTNGQECFPFICTTGSFLKKLMNPDTDPSKVSFFMPDHNGPCRFGEYNKLQRIIFDKLGYIDAEIIHPSNEDSYGSIAPGQSMKWRKAAWKGIVASDMLRKMQEQTRPYELIEGETDRVYQRSLQEIIRITESGENQLNDVLNNIARNFKNIPVKKEKQKPIVAVVGEIFMRDNPFCSNNLVKKLEQMGAETLMAPFGEWVNYSSYRYLRDSKWKNDIVGILKSRIQMMFQKSIEMKLHECVSSMFNFNNEPVVAEMLNKCGNYIHRDYDGDPPLALGTAHLLAGKHIAGVVNILPFGCLPGTINCTVSLMFKKDHQGIPWENFAWDGNDNIGLSTRFEAFMYQVNEYHQKMMNEVHGSACL